MSFAYTKAVVLINDWAHVARKWEEGLFAKRMHHAEANKGFIKLTLDDLRAAPTDAAFDGLVEVVLEVWRAIGEGDFADYFAKTYLAENWKRWYLGATPAGVGSGGQQMIENSHRGDKCVVGKGNLRLGPSEFLEHTLPIILRLAGEKLDDHPPEKVRSQTCEELFLLLMLTLF
jgi:hypothetical protein